MSEQQHAEITMKTFEEVDELTDIEGMVEFAGNHLEDLNFHSLTGLPYELWLSVKDTVSHLPHDEKVLIVRAMMKPFLSM